MNDSFRKFVMFGITIVFAIMVDDDYIFPAIQKYVSHFADLWCLVVVIGEVFLFAKAFSALSKER